MLALYCATSSAWHEAQNCGLVIDFATLPVPWQAMHAEESPAWPSAACTPALICLAASAWQANPGAEAVLALSGGAAAPAWQSTQIRLPFGPRMCVAALTLMSLP